jgi:hypothetical protein
MMILFVVVAVFHILYLIVYVATTLGVIGPVEHVRTSGETLSRSAFVRRSWSRRVLGARRRLCPIDAKG